MDEEKPHGWKTYLAAAAAIITGISMAANGRYAEGAMMIVGGLALVGVRGAIARVIETLAKR